MLHSIRKEVKKDLLEPPLIEADFSMSDSLGDILDTQIAVSVAMLHHQHYLLNGSGQGPDLVSRLETVLLNQAIVQ